MEKYKGQDKLYFIVSGLREIKETIKEGLAEIAKAQRTTCAKPAISCSENLVTITCATSGAEIHYTTDGSVPTKDSPLYSEAFAITEDTTVKAVAVLLDKNDSEVATAECAFTPTCATPVFGEGVTKTVTCATEGATIHYSDDGEDPSETSPVVEDGEIDCGVYDVPTVLKAIAIKDGFLDSAVASVTYTPQG